MDKIKIGQHLKFLRESKGVSQLAMANKLEEQFEIMGISTSTISKWETGKALPSADNLIMLSKYFDVSLDNILCGDDIVEYEFDIVKMMFNKDFDGDDRRSYISFNQTFIRVLFRSLLKKMALGELSYSGEVLFDKLYFEYFITSDKFIEVYTPLYGIKEVKMMIKKSINDGIDIDEKMFEYCTWFELSDRGGTDPLVDDLLNKNITKELIDKISENLNSIELDCLLMSLLSINTNNESWHNIPRRKLVSNLTQLIIGIIDKGATINDLFRISKHYLNRPNNIDKLDLWEKEFSKKACKQYYIYEGGIVSVKNDYFKREKERINKILKEEGISIDSTTLNRTIKNWDSLNVYRDYVKERQFDTKKALFEYDLGGQLCYVDFESLIYDAKYLDSLDEYENNKNRDLTKQVLKSINEGNIKDAKQMVYLRVLYE